MKLRVLWLSFVLVGTRIWAAEPTPTKWMVNGAEREALIYLPSKSPKSKSPVILAFHGHGGNMQFAAHGMAFQDYWPEAIVVYPQGLPTAGLVIDPQGREPGWQRAPGQVWDRDLKFVDAILKTLREKYSIDENRIYATGFSNGGMFTYLLLSQRANVFAAFAPGGAVVLDDLPLPIKRPVLHFGGKTDRLAKFENQEATIQQIRKLNGCATQGEPCGENCTLYPSAKGAPVETYIHQFGHLYPRKVTPLIVKFFQDNPRRP